MNLFEKILKKCFFTTIQRISYTYIVIVLIEHFAGNFLFTLLMNYLNERLQVLPHRYGLLNIHLWTRVDRSYLSTRLHSHECVHMCEWQCA